MNKSLTLTIICLAFGSATMATAQENPEADVTFDGLVRVKNSVFAKVWIDPEIDLTVYNKIMLQDAKFEFRAVRAAGGTTRYSSKSEFPISEKNQQRLIKEVTEVFDEELRKSKFFTIVEEPGPDVLILQGALLDIVSRVPPQRAGRSEIYLSRIGEATLILQLVDSMSGETLVRAAERRAAEPAGRVGMQSSTVTTWIEVRRLARRWGRKLRSGLDSVHKGG